MGTNSSKRRRSRSKSHSSSSGMKNVPKWAPSLSKTNHVPSYDQKKMESLVGNYGNSLNEYNPNKVSLCNSGFRGETLTLPFPKASNVSETNAYKGNYDSEMPNVKPKPVTSLNKDPSSDKTKAQEQIRNITRRSVGRNCTCYRYSDGSLRCYFVGEGYGGTWYRADFLSPVCFCDCHRRAVHAMPDYGDLYD